MKSDDVIRDAQERTNIRDLHTDSFREGLDVIADVVNTEIDSAANRRRITIECTKSLMSRLRIDDWLARHPTVTGAPVERPVFVIGMPRTGTR